MNANPIQGEIKRYIQFSILNWFWNLLLQSYIFHICTYMRFFHICLSLFLYFPQLTPTLTGEESIELILEFAAPALLGNFCPCCQLGLYSADLHTYMNIHTWIYRQIHKYTVCITHIHTNIYTSIQTNTQVHSVYYSHTHKYKRTLIHTKRATPVTATTSLFFLKEWQPTKEIRIC